MFQILAKPEYMPTFGDTAGPEEVPVEERLKYWIHTLLRPQALLLLGAWRCVVRWCCFNFWFLEWKQAVTDITIVRALMFV
jgi:hypothetical protein